MVSRIGRPITEPACIEVRVATYHSGHGPALWREIEDIVERALGALPDRTEAIAEGDPIY